tara:strand:+ start:928 stop:1329 length:402 start_codon:yes stop_codon:yes gene_type:complete
MGKKRRLLSAKGKFGNKFSAHPRYKAVNPVPAPKVNDDLSIIAKKIETIETEVLKTQDEIKKVVIEATPTPEPAVAEAPTPVVTETVTTAAPTQAAKSTIVKKKAPAKKKAATSATKRKSTTKRKTTSTTAKN